MSSSIQFLGTSAALPTERMHTSFFIDTEGFRMLVDVMGGYDIVRALRKNQIDISSLQALFITHRDLDHALGFPWIVRSLWTEEVRKGGLPKDFHLQVLCSKQLQKRLMRVIKEMCPTRWESVKSYITFVKLRQNRKLSIGSIKIQPLDSESKKTEQFGFVLESSNMKIAFTGDEPMRAFHIKMVKGSNVLIHEAFCLDTEKQKFKPHEKSHGTVLEAAKNAAAAQVKKLCLVHIADEQPMRRERFTAEAKTAFHGEVLVPEDGDKITL